MLSCDEPVSEWSSSDTVCIRKKNMGWCDREDSPAAKDVLIEEDIYASSKLNSTEERCARQAEIRRT
jgi:hypothetical protein